MRPTDFIPQMRVTGPCPYEIVEKGPASDYEVSRRLNGYCLSLNDRMRRPILHLWKKYRIEEVRLGGVLGWKQADISFLADLPHFNRLTMHPAGSLTWKVIERLRGLTELKIVAAPCEPEEDLCLGQLKELKRVELPWSRQWNSVLSNRHVQSLQIQDARGIRELDLRLMDSLAEFQLVRCRTLKRIVVGKQQFKAFEISLCPKFIEIDPESALESVEYLRLHGRVTWDYRRVRNFRNLRQLTLAHMGKLPTLRFLRDLKKLEYLDFGHPTVIEDGDLRFLDELPKLKAVAYDKSKQHYFPKRGDDWWEELERRRRAAGWNF